MIALTYAQYYLHALAAYAFVQSKMTIGAGNRVISQPGGMADVFDRQQCVTELRKTTEPLLKAADSETAEGIKEYARKRWGQNPDGSWGGTKGERDLYVEMTVLEARGKAIEINATHAEKAGCGNCEEQSSMVFKFLKDRGVAPLDWIEEPGIFGTGFGNHAFVILGRDKKTDAGDVASWNAEVVWCDPYEGKLGGRGLIFIRFAGTRLRLLHRFDAFSAPLVR